MSENSVKNSSSSIWRYFEPVDVKNNKCLLCDCLYRNSGNTTNLIDHLKRRHRSVYNNIADLLKNESNEQYENTEIPIAIENIKYETQSMEDEIKISNDNNSEIMQTTDEILIEQDGVSNTMTTNELENQINENEIDNNKTEYINEEETQDIQIVKIVPLPHARSEVWTYFGFVANDEGQILDRTKVVCKICASTFCYSGNTTNFYSHLKSMHSEVQIRAPFKNNKNLKRTYTSMAEDSGDIDYANDTNNTSTFNVSHNLAEDESIPARSRSDLIYVEDITQSIIDFLVTDCRPLCVVQGKGFQRLLRLLAPGYSMPDKQKLSIAIRKKYDEMRKERENSATEKFNSLDF